MSYLESELHNLLYPLAKGGAWPISNIESTPVWPYIVYNKISGIEEETLDGYFGLEDTLFQIDIYAKTYGEAKKISGLVFKAITEAFPSTSHKEMEKDGGYNKDLEDYRVITEYKVWSTTD